MNIISLYSGADNLGDGIIQAGGKIKICVEKDKDCCETIKLNHPDIEIINGLVSDHLHSLPKTDCVVGGPPCPEFSRAKTNRTMDLCEINNFKLACELTKSKFYFMENVQDLVKVNPERNFLINCADFGVPQKRLRRIFTNLKAPIPTHAKNPSNKLFGEPLKKWVTVKEALNLNEFIYNGKSDSKSNINKQQKIKILDKTQLCWKKKTPIYETDEPHPRILTDVSCNGLSYVTPTGFKDANKKQISNHIDQPMMTIVNGNGYDFTDAPKMSEKYKQFKNNYNVIRKLTNSELAILQGFRKDFKFFGSKTSIRKQIGNALPSIISKSFFTDI